MFEKLREFIAEVVSPGAQDQQFDDTGYRLAATALMIHVISLDGEPSAIEKDKLHSLIETRFGLDPGTADKLIAAATLVEGEAVDLYHFTSVIMRAVDETGRVRIVEMMWELVFADGKVSDASARYAPATTRRADRPHATPRSPRTRTPCRRRIPAPTSSRRCGRGRSRQRPA